MADTNKSLDLFEDTPPPSPREGASEEERREDEMERSEIEERGQKVTTTESRLMISKIVCKDFKSYAGVKELGPFHKVRCTKGLSRGERGGGLCSIKRDMRSVHPESICMLYSNIHTM
jgi:hypothetical protein